MRRRRFPRRPIRPRRGMRPARLPVPPKLREAHRLFEVGEYQKAAELYLDLADKANQRGIPQAPNLYLRGAAALLKAGDPNQAGDTLKRGLGILIEGERWPQLKKAGTIAVDRLKAEGQPEKAEQIQNWIEEQVPQEVKGSVVWQGVMYGSRSEGVKLPATCGQCGGPVHPGEVEWYDRRNPVCSYCGAVLEEREA